MQLGPATLLPQLGAPRFRDRVTQRNQTPQERQAYEFEVKRLGYDLPTYLEQEERETDPGGPMRRRPFMFAPTRSR